MTDVQREEHTAQSVGAPSIGDHLREAREARGESLSDVAFALKLTLRQVEAMENGRFDLLPGPAFVRGFLRNYARYLGLDPVQVVAALEQQQSVSGPSVVLAPVSNADGVVPNGTGSRPALMPAVIVAGLLLFAVLAGWYFDWFQMPGAEDGQGEAAMQGPDVAFPQPELLPDEPQRPDGNASESIRMPDESARPPVGGGESSAPQWAVPESGGLPPVPPATPSAADSPSPPADAPATTPQPQVSAAETGAVPSEPREAGPSASGAAEPASPAGDAAETASAAGSSPAAETSAPQPEPTPAASAEEVGKLVFQMRGESWIEVRDASGKIRYSGVSAAGSTRVVQGRPPFAVVVGNAPDVVVEYNGQRLELAPHTRVGVARMTVK